MTNTPDQSVDEASSPSLSESDLNTLLDRAIREGGFSPVDFMNCNNGDLFEFYRLIELKRRQDERLDLGQIHSQVHAELEKRYDQGSNLHETQMLQFERNRVARELKRAAESSLRERLEDEFGQDLHVLIGERNQSPTRDNWGVMTVSLAEDEVAAMDFVRANVEAARSVEEQLNRQFDGIKSLGGVSYDRPYVLNTSSYTPDEVLLRGQSLEAVLSKEGGYKSDKYPALFHTPNIQISTDDGISSFDGRLKISVDVRKDLEHQLKWIRTCLEDGDPRSIREKNGIIAEDPDTLKGDKAWLIEKIGRELVPEEARLCFYWLHVGHKDEAPTLENWGELTIDVNSSDQMAEAFLRAHIKDHQVALDQIDAANEQVNILAQEAGFFLNPKDIPSSSRTTVDPNVLFSHGAALVALVKQANVLATLGTNEKYLHVDFDHKNSIHRRERGSLSLTLNLDQSVQENRDFLLLVAKTYGFMRPGSDVQ